MATGASEPLPPWSAKWIWLPAQSAQAPAGFLSLDEAGPSVPREAVNRFVYFRRTWILEDAPESATLRISADSRYNLYINGEFIGRGPARGEPAFQPFDTYEAASALTRGDNCIAVAVRWIGFDVAWYRRAHYNPLLGTGLGGLLLQCDARTSAGESVQLVSDRTWTALHAQAWRQDAPRVGFSFPRMEIFDASADVEGWTGAGFDDAQWAPARELRGVAGPGAEIEPYVTLTERGIPPLYERPLRAARVVHAGEVVTATAPDPGDQMMREEVRSLSACSISDAEALLADNGTTTIRTADGTSAAILLDFGKTVTGYPHVDVDANAGAMIDIGVSERMRNKRIALNPVVGKQVTRYITRAGRRQWEAFHWAGFRYMQITVRHAAEPVAIHSAGITETGYPVSGRGRFECSDAMLTKIWNMGTPTPACCMHDAYEDCPSREQRQWVGDAFVEARVNYAAFGDSELTARLLRLVAQSQRSDGMTEMYTSGDYTTLGTTIPDYCLYWIMTAQDYYMHTGDTELLRELYPSMARAVEWFRRKIDARGVLADLPYWLFIDWAEVDKRGAVAVHNCQFAHTLECMAAMAKALGYAPAAKEYSQLARAIKKAVRKYLWNKKRRAYADCIVGEELSPRVSQQSNAMALLYGVATKAQAPHILDVLTDHDAHVMTRHAQMPGMNPGAVPHGVGGAVFDEDAHIVLAQPFFMHHVHRALAKHERHTDILDNIRRHWGQMATTKIDGDDPTTLWEKWTSTDSLCHAWSATPTYDLSTDILGVGPAAPGWKSVRIAPQTAGLEWAKGVYPAACGDISVEWTRNGERFELDVQLPEDVRCDVRLPADTPKTSTVTVNGKFLKR